MAQFAEHHQFIIGIGLGILLGLALASVLIYFDMKAVERIVRL